MGRAAIVAGTGYEGRAEIIRSHVKDGMRVTLKREPRNPHDPNAIAVYIVVPILFGLLGGSQKQIGYIKAGAAKSLAKRIDAGEKLTAYIKSFDTYWEREHPRVSLQIDY